MSIPKCDFSKHWTNPADFPTIETDESRVRADLQALHDETKDYFNTTLLPQIDSEIDGAKEWVSEAVKNAVLGALPDGSVTGAKLAQGAVTAEKLADGAVTAEKLAEGTKLPSPAALRVGSQSYDGTRDVELSCDGMKLGAAAAELGLGQEATMNQALAALAPALGALQAESGSYTGTGTVGSSKATVLNFSFVPKLVIIGQAGNGPSFYESTSVGIIWFEGMSAIRYKYNSGSAYTIWTNFAVSGNSLRLWGSETHTDDYVPTVTAASQYNTSGTRYVYLGLGVKEGG